MRVRLSALVLAVFGVSGHAAESVIEEIVVTAQKREQNLQETPLAVSAFTTDTVEERQIDGVRKLSQLAPSLVFNQSGAAANTYMRGVGQDISTVLGEPGVALFVDGVYQGVNFAQVASYNDLERIEVLRGPQGTLYGRNTTGGNINLYTKTPGFEPGAQISVLYGDYDRVKVAVSGQAPLIEDRLAVRASFVTDSNDGYRKNTFNGKDVEERDILSGALSLLWTPSETFEVILRADWNEQDDDNPAWDYFEVVPGSGLFPQAFGGTSAPGADKVRLDRDNEYTTEHWGVSADVTWDVGAVTIKSITAWRESDYDANYDNDGTDIAFLDTVAGQYAEQFTQEITVSGAAFNDRLEWIAGGFYFDQDIEAFFVFDLAALQPFFEFVFPDIQNGFLPPLPPGGLGDPTRNLFYAPRIFTGQGSAIPFLDFTNFQDSESIAAFVQGTYSVTDSFRVTGGVRYTEDEKSNVQTVVANISPAECVDLVLSDEWEEVTWRLGADFDVGESTLVYASASRGFKSGGFDGGTCANNYDPETVNAYEAGVKSTLADGRVLLNLAAFFYDYEDFQARLFVNNASIVRNASDTEMTGVEAEFVFVAGNGFEFDTQISWMDTEYKDFITTNPMTNMLDDASGNQVLRAPDFSVNAGVQYTFPIGDAGDLTFRYEASYKDDYYTTVFNDDFALVPSYTLQNARVIFRSNESWEIQGFVENLTDEEYVENLLPAATLGGVIGGWAPPRIWGLQVTYRAGAN
jgi:iron complex outermembrane receptor protein